MTYFPRATPESQGIESQAIEALLSKLADEKVALHSLMVVRHGNVVAEGWWKPYTAEQPHMMFSISKSITATAIGIAEAEGLLSVDDPILSFFPSYATKEVIENVEGLRVRDVLAMATGHAVDTMEIMRALPHEDWVKVFFGVPIEYPPGTHFLYNSGASFVLAALITSRTGQSPRDYLASRLFGPLGLPTPPWESNPRGINFGASGVRLRTEELAVLSQLYLQRGVWQGRRLLTEKWLDEATAAQVSNGTEADADWGQGYGFQIWRSLHNSYRFDGRYGQFSFVLPEEDLVVVMTAGETDNRRVPPILWETLLPGLHAEPLDDVTDTLSARLAAVEVELPAFVSAEQDITVKAPEVPFNTLGVTGVTVEVTAERAFLTTINAAGVSERVPAGRDEWLEGATRLWPYEEMDEVVTFSRFGWIDEKTLEIHQQCVDTPFRRVWRFDLATPGRVVITVGLDNGFWVERTEVLDSELLAD